MKRVIICTKTGHFNTIVYDNATAEINNPSQKILIKRKDEIVGVFNIKDIIWWIMGENIEIFEESLHCTK